MYRTLVNVWSLVSGCVPDMSGGPCKEHCYLLDQIAIHWGEDDSCGSEHLINTEPYSAEVRYAGYGWLTCNETLHCRGGSCLSPSHKLIILAPQTKAPPFSLSPSPV